MPTKLLVTLAVAVLTLGASYAFADGILNDHSTTRTQGGVGNYLFRQATVVLTTAETDADADAYESAALATEEDISVQQSSADRPASPILFDVDSSTIKVSEKSDLDQIAEQLKADSSRKAEIVGHADATGRARYNERLSERRAQAIVRGLKSRGVSENQISWSAKGESSPKATNETEEGRAKNRRGVIRAE